MSHLLLTVAPIRCPPVFFLWKFSSKSFFSGHFTRSHTSQDASAIFLRWSMGPKICWNIMHWNCSPRLVPTGEKRPRPRIFVSPNKHFCELSHIIMFAFSWPFAQGCRFLKFLLKKLFQWFAPFLSKVTFYSKIRWGGHLSSTKCLKGIWNLDFCSWVDT